MQYASDDIKVFENDKCKERPKELDIIKTVQKLIENYNQNSQYHYLLRLKIAVRKKWF
jgi:hypothetical protein